MQDPLRQESIENYIKSSSILYAHANAKYGEPLPKIRFVKDIPFLLQVNFPKRRRYGWRTHSILDTFGIDMCAQLDELHAISEGVWDVVMVSFPNGIKTQSTKEAVLTYHQARASEETSVR